MNGYTQLGLPAVPSDGSGASWCRQPHPAHPGRGFPPAISLDVSFSGCFKGENSPLLWSCWRKPPQHPRAEHFLWEITSAFSFPDLFLLWLLIM